MNFLKKFIARILKIFKNPNPSPDIPTENGGGNNGAPPPVDSPPNIIIKKWDIQPLWSRGKDWKTMFVMSVPRGILFSIYHRFTRKNSELYELRNLNTAPVRIFYNDAETIGPGTIKANKLYLPAEKCEYSLVYDLMSGQVTSGVKIPENCEYNIFSTFWKNEPVIGGIGKPGSDAVVFSAITGNILHKLPAKALICGMVPDEHNVLWCAMGGTRGERGVCNTRGEVWRDFPAASIAYAWGTIIAGGQETAILWRLTSKKTWEKWIDLNASKINRMVFDDRRYVLLVAASNPDTFVAIHQNGTIEEIFKGPGKKEVTGEQFDATINVGAGNTILFAHSTENGTYIYSAKPV